MNEEMASELVGATPTADAKKAKPTEGAISDEELDGATGGKSESVPDKFDPLLIEIINRKQGVLYEGQKSERKVWRT